MRASWKLGFLLLTLLNSAWGAFDHNHASWGVWLKNHVTEQGTTSDVNYRKAKEDTKSLEIYLRELEGVSTEDFAMWKDSEKLAFLINAHNAFTVKLVIENYPLASLKDLGGLLSSPWTRKFFKLFGKDQSLEGIEHGMLRKIFREPRAVLTLHRGARGGAGLSRDPYLGTGLEGRLDTIAGQFLNDGLRNRYVDKDNRIYLSALFDWYATDFIKKYGSLHAFLVPRLAKDDVEKARLSKATLAFIDFDWRLNDIPVRGLSSH